MDRRTEEREKERASDAMDRSDAVAVCLCYGEVRTHCLCTIPIR